jgi:hypothetical protein
MPSSCARRKRIEAAFLNRGSSGRVRPVGFQNLATGPDLGLCGAFIFVDGAAEDGPALDPFLGKVRGRMVGLWWAEPEAAIGG